MAKFLRFIDQAALFVRVTSGTAAVFVVIFSTLTY